MIDKWKIFILQLSYIPANCWQTGKLSPFFPPPGAQPITKVVRIDERMIKKSVLPWDCSIISSIHTNINTSKNCWRRKYSVMWQICAFFLYFYFSIMFWYITPKSGLPSMLRLSIHCFHHNQLRLSDTPTTGNLPESGINRRSGRFLLSNLLEFR